MKPVILTRSGIEFNLLEPTPEMIKIEDIAHALSHLCRFTGHTHCFYSVAMHSYQASYLVPPECMLEALLHDAAEAYVGDVSSPLKSLLSDYRYIEKRIDAVIRERFGLPKEMSACVKQADLRRLAAEKRHLMPLNSEPWEILEGVEADPIGCMTFIEIPTARELFLTRFHSLATCTASSAI